MLKENRNRRFQDMCVAIVQSDDLKALQNLLEKDKKIDLEIGNFGLTFLHLCAIFGSVKIASWLLNNGAKVNKKECLSKKTPFHLAAYFGHLNILELLLKHSSQLSPKLSIDKAGCLPIHYACMQGHLEIVHLLVKWVDNPNIFSKIGTPLDIAIRKGNYILADFLSSNIGLFCLISLNPEDRYDIDFQSRCCRSPFHLAVAADQKEIAKMLCHKFPQYPWDELKEFWDEIEEALSFFAILDRKSQLPLLYSSKEIPRVLETIDVWISNQKTKFPKSGALSELFQAVLNGDLNMVKSIVQAEGIEILSKEQSGLTPLGLADELCFFSLFDWLARTKLFYEPHIVSGPFFSRWLHMEIDQMTGGFFHLILDEIEIITLKYHIEQDKE